MCIFSRGMIYTLLWYILYTLCIYGSTHYYAYPFTCQLTSSDLTDIKRQCVVAYISIIHESPSL